MNHGDDAQFQNFVRGREPFPYREEMFYEVHFMAHNPEKLIPDWVRIGARRFLFHIEAKHDFGAIRMAAGECELGVSVNIGTPLERIDNYIEHISVIQFMGIAKIGIQGQPFDPRVLDMLRKTHAKYPSVILEVDGAVNLETAPDLVAAGATRLAPGSYIFKADDPKQAAKDLQNVSHN
jgi:ribulose-phosphate 3-epimerase